MLHTWLVLLLSVPPRPSSLRVRAWRKLRALGAVALRSGAWLLPASPERHEQCQWLAQEVSRGGGEATLLRVDQVENMRPAELVRLFQQARGRDWAALAGRYRKLLRAERRRAAREAGRLDRERERLAGIDFFEAPERREAERAREAVLRRAAAARPGRPAPAAPPLDLAALRGRRWATRPRPHVDRIASAWLIKRFIDPAADFVFAAPEDLPADAIPFDVAGAELGHQGQDCTFETLLRRAGLRDRRLDALAEIVHEADLDDGKYRREEARGVDLLLRGLLEAVKDDHEVLAQGLVLLDGLYASLGERR